MKLEFDAEALRPVITSVVTATLAQLANESLVRTERLAFREEEAAAMIGVAKHVLRDARRRGEIHAVKAGRYIVYRRDELIRYLGGSP
jgi:hypothetical protein